VKEYGEDKMSSVSAALACISIRHQLLGSQEGLSRIDASNDIGVWVDSEVVGGKQSEG
jgi:hypothetical protein